MATKKKNRKADPLAVREQEIKTAINEMIDTVERYFAAVLSEFPMG